MYSRNRDIARYESIFINFEQASYEIEKSLDNFHYEKEILQEILDSVELGEEAADSEFRGGLRQIIRELTDDPSFWEYPDDFPYHPFPYWPYPFRRLFRQLESSERLLLTERIFFDELLKTLLEIKIWRNKRKLASDGLKNAGRDRGIDESIKPILELIIFAEYRPALSLNRNYDMTIHSTSSVTNGGKSWKTIFFPRGKNTDQNIKERCKAVARIETPNYWRGDYAGTGFLVRKKILLTARHVAEFFCNLDKNQKLVISPSVNPGAHFDILIRFRKDMGDEFEITKLLYMSDQDDYDFAIFEVEETNRLPIPMQETELKEDDLEGRFVYLVGHPGWDPESSATEMLSLFRGQFGYKYILPGRLAMFHPISKWNNSLSVLQHDASTLGGCSGGCLVDLGRDENNVNFEGNVIGLHFAGIRGKTNLAVPSWKLINHPKGGKFFHSD